MIASSKKYLLERTFGISFAILFALASFSYYLTVKIVDEQNIYGKLINMSGKQRMLSQKITLSAYSLLHDKGLDSKNELTNLLDSMKNDYDFILKNLPSKNLLNYYKDSTNGNNSIEYKIVEFFNSASRFIDSPIEENLINLKEQSQSILYILDDAVSILEAEHKSVVEKSKNLSLYIFAATLAALFITGLLIIRPVLIQVQKYTKDLEQEVQKRIQDLMVFSVIFENSNEGMSLVDEDEKIITVNKAYTNITGYTKEESVGKTPRILKSFKQGLAFYEDMWSAIETEGIWSGEIINRHKSGNDYHEHLTIIKLMNPVTKKVNYVSIFSDISEVYSTLEKFQKLIDLQSNIIVVTDGSKIIFANKRFYEFFGYTDLDTFTKEHICICDYFIKEDNFFTPDQVVGDLNWIEYILTIEQNKRIVLMKDTNAISYAFQVTANKYEDNSSVLVFTDVSKAVTEKEKLRLKAQRDKLTGCYNREFLINIFDNYVSTSLTLSKYTILLIIDIDYFKKINDTYGHNRGDEVLKQFSNIINKNIREEDVFVRWGGEEFVVLMRAGSLDDSYVIAEKFRIKIENEIFEEVGRITASFGATVYKDSQTLEEIIEEADKALYKAKKNGRNRVEVFQNKDLE